ncbi:MAG: hypothetical protein ABFS39_12530 [Pseudomonadota bacterium]
MGFFKKFGWNKGGEESPRCLEHPRDLEPGDMLKFAFSDQGEISGASFTLDRVRTLDLGGDDNKLTYFMLSDAENQVRLRVVDDDTLEVALEVLPDALFSAVKKGDVAMALDPDSGSHNIIKARKVDKIPLDMRQWVGKVYRQEGYVKAYRYEGDYRKRALPTTIQEGEQGCDYAYFVSDDRQRALEIRVFEGGRTEVHLCVFLPLRKIEELWPGSGGGSV